MKKATQLILLTFVVATISACGKTGDLEAVKAEKMVLSPAPVTSAPAPTVEHTHMIDESTRMVAPELDVLPHNSK